MVFSFPLACGIFLLGGGCGALLAHLNLMVVAGRIRKELARAENVVIESNSILRFLRPDLYLSVLDPGTADFKESARYFLDRADAVLVAEGELGRPEWKGVSLKLVEGTPVLAMRPPVYVTDEVAGFVRERLRAGMGA